MKLDRGHSDTPPLASPAPTRLMSPTPFAEIITLLEALEPHNRLPRTRPEVSRPLPSHSRLSNARSPKAQRDGTAPHQRVGGRAHVVVPRAAQAQRRKLVAVGRARHCAANCCLVKNEIVESFWFRIDLAPQFAARSRSTAQRLSDFAHAYAQPAGSFSSAAVASAGRPAARCHRGRPRDSARTMARSAELRNIIMRRARGGHENIENWIIFNPDGLMH